MIDNLQQRDVNYMNKKRKATGFTLIEVLISSIIMFMLVGILFFMVIRGKMAWHASTARSASRQDLQVTSWKIAHELKGTDISLITDGSTGNLNAFSFISAYDQNSNFVTDSSGSPLWQKYVIYYIPSGTSKLIRKEIAVDPSQSATLKALTVSQLTGYLDGKGIVASPSVISLKLTPNTGENYVTLELSTETKNRQGKTDKQSRQMTIAIYNNQVR